MPLATLPPELLTPIIEHSFPDSYEPLMLTSPSFYTLGRPLRDRHNALRRTYANFAYGVTRRLDAKDDEGPIVSPLQLLHEIWNEPIIARYITHADFRAREFLGNSASGHASSGLLREVVESGSIHKLVHKSRCLDETRARYSVWEEHILRDENLLSSQVDFGSIFLLTLLPNLREVVLPSGWELGIQFPGAGCSDGAWRALDWLVRNANTGNQGAALGKLQVVDTGSGLGQQNCFGAIALMPFLALESVEEVYAGSVVACEESGDGAGIALTNPFVDWDSLGKNLRVVEMPGMCVDEWECLEMFGEMANLRVLRLSFEMKPDWGGYRWNAHAFVSALSRAVGNGLETLSLTASDESVVHTSPHSMQGFKKLKELEMDTRIFSSINRLTSETPRLVDILPKSLEKLRILGLNTKSSQTCLEGLFEGFDQEAALELVNLQAAYVELPWPESNVLEDNSHVPKSIKDAQQKQGVRVVGRTGPDQAKFSPRFKM